ncbi:MAG TPA: pyridoxal-dependent decarboxylase [Gemmatimonadaceae bacterium]|nr:pyridoxal-dependent decarboxylase [Gemmatimonadaceae bacterium]
MPDDILSRIEQDATRDAGELFLDLTARYLEQTRAEAVPVSTSLDASTLAIRFNEPLPRRGKPLAEVVARLERDVVADSNKLYHPMYMGHQVSAPVPAAIWSEMVTAAVNNSAAVWEMSPTATVIETRVVRWLCELAGLGPASGGTLTTGGTEATFTALLAARAAAVPDVWHDGVPANPPVLVYGAQAHYAVTRAAGELGIGLRHAIAVPTRDHRMDLRVLREILDQLAAAGRGVMAVVATAGSTPTGSFDDLESIGALCAERGIWLHVDAAHGGSALFSRTHASRIAGISRASSIAWDPHKMMLIPLQAGVVLVRDEALLESAFAQKAPYLFHGARGEERVWDQGTRSFLCSRRADVIKLWVALQRYGADGFGELYDRLCETTRALYDALRSRPDFETLHEPESNILCFRYTGRDADDALNLKLREEWNRSGEGWITTTLLDGRRVLRVTVMNPRTTSEHVRRLVDGLARLAGG